MTMAIPNRFEISTAAVYAVASVDWDCKSYIDHPRDHWGKLHGRLLKYIHVMNRKGFACWMQEIPFCGVESCANVPSSGCKAKRTRSDFWGRRIDMVALARPPPMCRWLATGQQAVALRAMSTSVVLSLA